MLLAKFPCTAGPAVSAAVPGGGCCQRIGHAAVAMADFLRFHHAQDLVVEKSTPADAGARLVKALEKEG